MTWLDDIKDLQQKVIQLTTDLLASQASEARLREAILKIEFEYDYTLDKEMTDAVVAGFKLARATPNTAELESFVAKAVESEIDKRLDKYKKFHHKLSESTFLLAISIMDNLEACKSTLIVKRLRNLQDTFTEYYETLR